MRESHSCVIQQVDQCMRIEEGRVPSQSRESPPLSESHEGSQSKKNETPPARKEEITHTRQVGLGWPPRGLSSTYSRACLGSHPLRALRLAPQSAQVWSADQSRSRLRSHSFAASTTTPKIVHPQGYALESAAESTLQQRLLLLGTRWPRRFFSFST